MAFLSDLQCHLDALRARVGDDCELADLVGVLRRGETDSVMASVADAAALINGAQRFMAVGAGVIAERSARDLGQSGVAAVRGHKTPVSLIQSITGGTKADAVRAVRVGGSLLEGELLGVDVDPDAAAEVAVPVEVAWHHPLRTAMLAGLITSAQYDAIRRGLGEPPVSVVGGSDASVVREVWSVAAEQLLTEVADLPVEELLRRARQVRDALDPVGAEERFARHYDGRSFRRWTDADGLRHGHFKYDDEGAAWVDALIDSALRPRRAGRGSSTPMPHVRLMTSRKIRAPTSSSPTT